MNALQRIDDFFLDKPRARRVFRLTTLPFFMVFVAPVLMWRNRPILLGGGASAVQLAEQFDLPVKPRGAYNPCDEAIATCEALCAAGDWDALYRKGATWDRTRAADGSGFRYHYCITLGALRPQDAILERVDPCAEVPVGPRDLDELERLELALAGRPGDHILAGILAMAHFDMAWARRGGGYAGDVSEAGWVGFKAHMERARELLSEYDARALDSPFLAAIRHKIVCAGAESREELERSFVDVMALDPGDWGRCRDHAFHLLPRWYGDYDVLDAAARTHMARTEETAGASAYTAHYLGVLHRDPGAIWHVDVPLFRQGVRDMLETHHRDQNLASELLAYGWLHFTPKSVDSGEGMAHLAEQRGALLEVARMIAQEYLEELDIGQFPMDETIDLKAVASFFHRDLAEGRRIAFGPGGAKISQTA